MPAAPPRTSVLVPRAPDRAVRPARDHGVMRTLLVAFAVALAMAVAAVAQAAPAAVSASQLKTGFKKATGQKLVVDTARSFPGHYTAFNLGVQTGTRQARYGTFTIYLVTDPDVATQVRTLLTDPHTGELGTPAAGGIYWEHDRTMSGTEVWLAKRQYGANVVLWWTSSRPVKKTDATFTTLHKALVLVAKKT